MTIILHYNGRYNFYSTILGAPVLSNALNQDEINNQPGCTSGLPWYKDYKSKVRQAKKYGSSCKEPTSLVDAISLNRAGKDGEHIGVDEFISLFLSGDDEFISLFLPESEA